MTDRHPAAVGGKGDCMRRALGAHRAIVPVIRWTRTQSIVTALFALTALLHPAASDAKAKAAPAAKVSASRDNKSRPAAQVKRQQPQRRANKRVAKAKKPAAKRRPAKKPSTHATKPNRTGQVRHAQKAARPKAVAKRPAAHRAANGQRRAQARGVRRRDPAKLVLPSSADSPLLNVAATYLGRPYRYGAQGYAFDCSGFVRTVFGDMGVYLPRSAREIATVGDRIDRHNLEPGDLVFFRNPRRHYIDHVGIYVGEDRFIHAATRAGQVQVDSLSDAYFRQRYIAARRIEI